jgi:uncharacterized protein YigE (DUF2233 family)
VKNFTRPDELFVSLDGGLEANGFYAHNLLMKWIGMLVGMCLVAGIAAADVREERVTHAGVEFRVVKLQPQHVGLVWRDVNGEPYRTFDRVQARFEKEGNLMNAGIFEPGGIPSGLHLEEGKPLRPLNTAQGEGNFYLQPNGVLLIGPTASVRSTEDFAASERRMKLHAAYKSFLRIGVQSGPMLLIDGKRHPAFKEGSSNKLHRNGVGVDGQGRVVFAITAPGNMVNLWDFAGLFARLGCRNALFLDGDISAMAVNPTQPEESNRFGAMFVVVE